MPRKCDIDSYSIIQRLLSPREVARQLVDLMALAHKFNLLIPRKVTVVVVPETVAEP